jgi:hypothetical protein
MRINAAATFFFLQEYFFPEESWEKYFFPPPQTVAPVNAASEASLMSMFVALLAL